MTAKDHYERMVRLWGAPVPPGGPLDTLLKIFAEESVYIEQRMHEQRMHELLDQIVIKTTAEAKGKRYRGKDVRVVINGKEVGPFPVQNEGDVLYEPAPTVKMGIYDPEVVEGRVVDAEGMGDDTPTDPTDHAPGLVPMSYPRLNRDSIAKTDVCYTCGKNKVPLWRFVRGPKDEQLTCEPCLRDHLGWEIDHVNRTLRKPDDI